MTPAMKFEEWTKGTDKDPILEEFDPAKLEAAKPSPSSFVFNKKPGAGAPEVQSK